MPTSAIPESVVPELFKRSARIVNAYVFSINGTDDYKFVANNADIAGGYTALAIKRSPIKSEEGTILQELEIGIDNVDLSFRSLVINGQIENKLCKVYSLFLNSNNTIIDKVLRMQGYVDAPKGDEHWLSVTIKPFPLLERSYPRRIFQIQCNWIFCDYRCGLYLDDYRVQVTLSSDFSGQILTISHGKSDDYFIPGMIEIMDGDYRGQSRPISDNDTSSVTLRIPFDYIIPSGTTIRLQKLCSKNMEDCKNIFNNFSKFGGFPFAPAQPIL